MMFKCILFVSLMVLASAASTAALAGGKTKVALAGVQTALTVLGAVADIKELSSGWPVDSGIESSVNAGFIKIDQESTFEGGAITGSEVYINELILEGANIAVLIADQVVLIRGGNADDDSFIVTNLLTIDNTNVAYLSTEQQIELLEATISASDVIVNTIKINNANAGGIDIKQTSKFTGTHLRNANVKANSVQIGSK